MHKIIYDCDNTMGVKERDVDDGLTFLYLLGRKDVCISGVTTTYGNSTMDIVYDNTLRMFHELSIQDIPLLRGASSPKNRHSEAAEFLAEKAAESPGEITVLATGSLTNLLGAYEIDSNFFHHAKQIILMGGITNPLMINGKQLDELNFSCDPEATYQVLSSGAKVTVITGHICLQALFGEKEYKRLMESHDIKIYQYIRNKTNHWFVYIMKEFGIKGFYNWDIVAGVYLTNPQLFDTNITNLVSTSEDLKTGLLKIDNNSNKGYRVNMPTAINNIEEFNEIIFNTWANVAYAFDERK
ncbi:nucleoside hydrolase [Thermotalea metallivorans]|uniref:Pyrimidine-specific ribonucleoside hydrolase RihA n=1 Tax=Thermotalea metallivorans TaxID=520762 RepID=A0A140KZZ5_9FIRM|nr:nucleoside hydrolase [Thermotalea metallivorans]KXG73870.1 Pyrimidine-specific ribonucleoside hydrolase RihA [Thermotalea metallivorans]